VNPVKTDFRGALFHYVNFRGANLEKADFSGASFYRADFRGAFLEGANFYGAKAVDGINFIKN
jgi:uncharacterized protein YjbI with pentapeptide repeats